jgi:hypothetical protein
LRGEDTAEEGARDGGETKCGGEQTLVLWALLEGQEVDEEDLAAGAEAGAADAGDGAAEDEDGGCWCGGAKDGADFEDDEEEGEDPFGAEVGLEHDNGQRWRRWGEGAKIGIVEVID